MTNSRYIRNQVACLIALLLTINLTSSCTRSPKTPSLSPQDQEAQLLGERIYREGVLPSEKLLRIFVKGDPSVPGTAFACASCHLRSGLGSFDEGVYTPPTNGAKLFQPLEMLYKGIRQNPKYFSLPPRRPAFTDASLSTVIRSGKDPAGRVLNDVMPRYLIEDDDMAILISYLKSLSSQFSPGVTDTTIRFATVITDDVSQEDREAMLAPLEYYFRLNNNQVDSFNDPRRIKSRRMAAVMLGSMELATKKILLSRWVLTGPPETWRNQLQEYNRREPVFALLGGITNGDWKPIHQFSEENQIPCLFPNTDFPVISDNDWYTLYLSKGYYQEGEGAARYLNSKSELINDKAVVQIVRASREGKALSEGFQQTWQDFGQQAPVTVTLQPGEKLSKDLLKKVLAKERPAALIVWDDPKALPALESLAVMKNRPVMSIVSSSYLGKSIWTLKQQIRDFTYITYPFSFSPYAPKSSMGGGVEKVGDDTQETLKKAQIPLADKTQKLSSISQALTQILTTALMDMKGNYYRDNLLDVIGMMMDKQYPLYGRISFGPGQRYASKGCFIVQLSKGAKPKLVKKSDWVIY